MKDVFAYFYFKVLLFQGAIEDFHQAGAIFGAAHFGFGCSNGAFDFFVRPIRKLSMNVFDFVRFARDTILILRVFHITLLKLKLRDLWLSRPEGALFGGSGKFLSERRGPTGRRYGYEFGA